LSAADREMFGPDVGPRIKETLENAGFWIDTREISAFVSVAVRAAPGQILKFLRSTMLLGDHVVQLKAKWGETFGKLTILAAPSSPTTDIFPQAAHLSSHGGCQFSLCPSSHQTEKISNTKVSFEFVVLTLTDLTGAILSQELINAVEILFRQAELAESLGSTAP
jgi:hypothetical protein